MAVYLHLYCYSSKIISLKQFSPLKRTSKKLILAHCQYGHDAFPIAKGLDHIIIFLSFIKEVYSVVIDI